MTVAELIDILARFDSETEVEFMSTDGPDYAWLDVGGNLAHTSAPYAPAAQISNEGLTS